MGIFNEVTNFLGLSADPGSLPAPPPIPREDLRDLEAEQLRKMYRDPLSSREFRVMRALLGDQAAAQLFGAKLAMGDAAARVSGPDSGAVIKAFGTAEQKVGEQLSNNLRRALLGLYDSRARRMSNLVGLESGHLTGTYAPFVGAYANMDINRFGPFKDFTESIMMANKGLG